MTRADLLKKLAKTVSELKKSQPVLVGIDGVDGAGKTTLANELVPIIQSMGRKVVRASIDGFHKPREVRQRQGILSPIGYFEDSFDYDFLVSNFFEPLKRSSSPVKVKLAKFDWKTNSDVNREIHVDEKTIILFDGVFLFRSEINHFWDYRIYVLIDSEVSLERGLTRDSELLGGRDLTREKYVRRYIPGQKIYHSLCQPQLLADVIVNNNNPFFPNLNVGRESLD